MNPTDHRAQGLAHRVSQFRHEDATNFETILVAYLDEVQEVEAAIQELLTGRFLDDATGYQIDVVGDLIGEPRPCSYDATPVDDARYRDVLEARLLVNRSAGEAETLLAITDRLTALADVRVIDLGRGTAIVAFAGDPTDGTLLARMLQEARAAGVRLYVIGMDRSDSTDAFEFAAWEADVDGTDRPEYGLEGLHHGFADDMTGAYGEFLYIDTTGGGYFADLIGE
jgi:hypothetical protein